MKEEIDMKTFSWKEKKVYYNQTSRSFCNYDDANLTTAIIWGGNFFTCYVKFTVWCH